MQHLRLVGVHEDGLHLLLADDEGNRYSLPLDESLRAAARRDRPRLGQLQIETTGGLRPKDVQSMIRAGMTAEDVAERAGWTVEKVHRYEGPILAEREHVAGLARQVRLRARGGSYGGAPTLDARVTERLRARQIDTGSARWDSRRTDKGAWTIVLLFNAGGRQREALWQFDPLARTVSALDDEARWLSEDEEQQTPGPIPAPHLSASTRPSRVYDVEAEGGVGASATRRRQGETVDLMAAIRERSSQRGRRRRPKSAEVPGLDEAPEEAMPLQELARDPREELPPPAHTHPEDDPDVVKTGSVEERVGAEAAGRKARRAEPTQPVRQPPTAPAEDVTAEEDRQPAPAGGRAPSPAGEDPGETAPEVDAGLDRLHGLEDDGTGSGDREADQTSDDTDRSPEGAEEEHDEPVPTLAAPDASTDDAAVGPPAARRPEASPPLPRVPSQDRQRGAAARREADSRDDRGARTDRPDHRDRDRDGDGEGYDVVEQRPAASTPKPAPRPAPPARKSGRPSVPSWDDIMFGRKDD